MNPSEITRAAAAEHTRDLQRSRRGGPVPVEVRRAADPVTIRWAGPADAPALQALAALDSRSLPATSTLVAERDGTIVAALPLGVGAPALSDPFQRTGEYVALLELRAEQLARAAAHPRRTRAARLLGPAVARLR
jgi:hypothetical protein